VISRSFEDGVGYAGLCSLNDPNFVVCLN